MFLVPSHDIFPAKDWLVVTSLFSYKYHDYLLFACHCWTSCCTEESKNNLAASNSTAAGLMRFSALISLYFI